MTVGRMPNFLYIGAPKAGSTWVYEALRSHPEVFLSAAKELHYFDMNYARGQKWYMKHFRKATAKHLLVGEISHNYLYSELACDRIAADLGPIYLLVVLREPVERAWSQYLYLRRQGYVRSSFEIAAKEYPTILEHGRYAEHLLRYREKFGSDSLRIILFDDLREDPVAFYQRLCGVLGIDKAVPERLPRGAVLAAAAPKNQFIARVAKEGAVLLRRAGMARTITRIKSASWVQSALYRQYSPDERPQIRPGQREQWKGCFSDDVALLDREFIPGIRARWNYE